MLVTALADLCPACSVQQTVDSLLALGSSLMDSVSAQASSEHEASTAAEPAALYSIQITEEGDSLLLPAEKQPFRRSEHGAKGRPKRCWHMALVAFVTATAFSAALVMAACRMRRQGDDSSLTEVSHDPGN